MSDEMKRELDQLRAELRQVKRETAERRAVLKHVGLDGPEGEKLYFDTLARADAAPAATDAPADARPEAERLAADKADFERQLGEMETKYEADMAARQRTIDDLHTSVLLTDAIERHGGDAMILKPHLLNRVRLLGDGDDIGQRQLVALDERGEPRLDAAGAPIPVDHLIEEMKILRPGFARAFNPAPASAGGNGKH